MKTKTEKSLYEILIENHGFKQNIIDVPANSREQRKKDFMPGFLLKLFPVKTVNKTCKDWLVATIDGNSFEAIFEDYSVILRKNGDYIFDKRRFQNEEFLGLLK